jgi:phage gpG-like protein
MDKALKRFGELQKRIGSAAEDFLNEEAVQLQGETKRRLTGDGTVHMGRLRSSIKVRKAEAESRGLYAYVYTNVKYAPAVEFGSRPHFPPIAPLSDWSKKKLGTDLGYVIARKISRTGTPAKPYMGPATEDVRRSYAKHAGDAVGGACR